MQALDVSSNLSSAQAIRFCHILKEATIKNIIVKHPGTFLTVKITFLKL